MVQVKIYSTKSCPFCKMQKEYFAGHKILFENVFVDEDTQAAHELMTLEGGTGVPFTVFTKEDGSKESVLGFDKEEINRLLNIG